MYEFLQENWFGCGLFFALLYFAKKEDMEVLFLAPDFQRYAEKNNVFLHGLKNSPTAGFGHWNIDGHRLAGEIIAEYFRSDGI